MKLPRHDRPRNVVSELTSLRNIMISPQEAANVQLAKYGMLASTASAASEIFKGIAEIKNEEEYTDAITTWESAVNSFNQGIKSMPPDKNDLGELVFDADKVISMERDGRQKITNDIRANIKSGTVKARFDKAIALDKPDRDERLMNQVKQKEAEFIEVKAVNKVYDLVAANQHEAALAKNNASFGNGAYGPVRHSANEVYIMKEYAAFNKRGDEDYVYTEMNDLNTTPADLQKVLENLANGTRGDGTPLSIEEKEKNILMGKLRTKMDTFEEDKDDAKKEIERTAFYELLRLGLKGELDLDKLEQTGNQIGGFDSGHETVLRDMATGVTTDNFSSADDLKFFSDSVDNLKYMVISDDMNWKEEADKLLLDIHLSKLSRQHKDIYKTKVETAINDLDDDRSKLVAGLVFSDLVGFDEGMLVSMNLSGEYDDKASMARRAKLALLDELERSGTSKGLLDWWEGTPAQPGMKQTYRAKLNSETIQKVMDKPVTFPVDGKIDEEWRTEVVSSMRTWYETNSRDSTQSEREADIDSAIEKFRKLTGIQLTDPVVRPIEVKQ